jgi:bis(5'-nucleosyl)-tetraphosphatase (symmetrical)
MQLLEDIHFDANQDRLWFVGDLINRGPDSYQVLRFISQLPSHHQSVLGNHDLHFLAVALGNKASKNNDTFDELLAAPDLATLVHWLRHQPLALYASEFNTLVIHAGVAPQWDLEETLALALEVEQQLQGPNVELLFNHLYGNEPTVWDPELMGIERLRFIINSLTRLRIGKPCGELDFSFKKGLADLPLGFVPWYQMPKRKTQQTRIAFGHWAALLGDTHGQFNVEATDTGCVWGYGLTALRLEDGVRFMAHSRASKHSSTFE